MTLLPSYRANRGIGRLTEQAKDGSKTKKRRAPQTIKEVDREIDAKTKALAELRGDSCYYPLLLDATHTTIMHGLVDTVFSDLRAKYGDGCDRMLVVVSSGGGNIDEAYNLALLFRRYGSERLTFVVPRWAKSAATLLVCAGDEVLMGPIAELGPLDPQITETNPLDNRHERFSPLHIKSTLDLINSQYNEGNKQLADALMARLQFPLTLGSYRKSLDLGKEYLSRLLKSRMLADHQEQVDRIANHFVEGYADHSACINSEEVSDLGLVANELTGDELDLAWDIHLLEDRKHELIKKKREEEMKKRLKDLPPEVLEKLGGDSLVLETTGKEQ